MTHSHPSSFLLNSNLLITIALLFTSTLCWAQTEVGTFGKLIFRDIFVIPNSMEFQGTPVGGLSSIDYDKTSDGYIMICDDRSALKPARYYRARIVLTPTEIDTVIFLDKVDLQKSDGSTYPKNSLDPEAMRFNPGTKELVWLSEGERRVGKDTLLLDPGIFITAAGKHTGEFPIAANARMTAGAQGPRQNGSFEALSFSDGGKNLWVALEEPLYQDGPRADVEESKSLVRFYKYDVATRANIAQYAYDLDPVAYAPILSSAFRVNGITDILEAGNDQLLVLERSFSTGRLPCTVKIFLADMKSGTEVKDIAALTDQTAVKHVSKQLLLNMDDLGIYIDNIEGITWGPVLPNGNRTLVLVSDNNFQSFQKTQILLFEVAASK